MALYLAAEKALVGVQDMTVVFVEQPSVFQFAYQAFLHCCITLLDGENENIFNTLEDPCNMKN